MTSFIPSAKRLLDNTSLLIGVGLKSDSGDVAGGRMVEGPRVRYMGGYSHCGQSMTGYRQTETGRGWSQADQGWSQSGPSQPNAHLREVGRRLGQAGQRRLPTSSRRARDVE